MLPDGIERRAGVLCALLLAAAGVGCGGSRPEPPQPGRKITPAEYRRMTPAERDDPYVIDNLEKPPRARTPARTK